MPTIEERLAEIEAFILKLTKGDGFLKSLTVYGQTAPSVEKRLELIESTIKGILDHNEKVLELALKSNEHLRGLVERLLPVEIRVAEHDAIFVKMREAAQKAKAESESFRKG